VREVVVKDEGQNPTGPLKDRASGVAVAKALEQGASVVSCSSTCNAASSLAGLASSAGLRSVIFVPERVPEGKLVQLLMFGSTVVRVQGAYSEAYDLSVAAIERYGWYKGVSRALRYWPGFSNSQDAGGSGSGLQSHVYGPSDWQSSFVWIWRYPGGFDSSLCSARFRKGAAGSRGRAGKGCAACAAPSRAYRDCTDRMPEGASNQPVAGSATGG
jgi:hypothetical protein